MGNITNILYMNFKLSPSVAAVWLLSLYLIYDFLPRAFMKLSGPDMLFQAFAGWGYPTWFVYVIGAVELIAPLMLLVPRIAKFGAAILAVLMLGVIGTHVMADQMAAIGAPIMLLVMSVAVLLLRLDITKK